MATTVKQTTNRGEVEVSAVSVTPHFAVVKDGSPAAPYTVTHRPTGRGFGFQGAYGRLRDAKQFCAALERSRMRWDTDPGKASGDTRRAYLKVVEHCYYEAAGLNPALGAPLEYIPAPSHKNDAYAGLPDPESIAITI